jgi:hypothetical protein
MKNMSLYDRSFTVYKTLYDISSVETGCIFVTIEHLESDMKLLF